MEQAPAVDGVLDEWGGALTYVEDEPVSLSVAPTDSLLYVAVSIQDRNLIRAVATKGLVVWVDPAGGKNRTFGVRYPLGLRAQQQTPSGTEESSASSRAAAQQTVGLDQVSLSELDVLRNDSTHHRIPANFSSGLRANATLNPGSLVYELAVPVGSGRGKAQRHGLRTALGSTVGIGLTTPESDDSDIGLPDRSMPSVTGRRTPRRGQRGRRGRQQAPSSSAEEELPSLDLWTNVVLNRTTAPAGGAP